MFDFQNLDAALSVDSDSNNRDAEQTIGQRKRNVGNTRRVALNRVLHREHKREMRDAMTNGTNDTSDFITDNCSFCGASQSNCMCCDDCGRYHCECTLDPHDDDRGDFRDVCTTCENYVCKCEEIAADNAAADAQNDIDYDPFWYEGYTSSRPRSYFQSDAEVQEFLAFAGGAQLEETVNGINDIYSLPIDLGELKLHDFFWRDYADDHHFDFNHHEGNNTMNDRNRNLTDTAAFVAAFTRELSDLSFEFPSQRRKFVVIPGGRTKKVRNRADNFYPEPRYKPSVARTNPFTHEEVLQFFDDVEQDRKDSMKARQRQEHDDRLYAYCNPANSNRSKRTPVVEVVAKAQTRRLPPGRVVKDSSGKLVWMVDEQALAA